MKTTMRESSSLPRAFVSSIAGNCTRHRTEPGSSSTFSRMDGFEGDQRVRPPRALGEPGASRCCVLVRENFHGRQMWDERCDDDLYDTCKVIGTQAMRAGMAGQDVP